MRDTSSVDTARSDELIRRQPGFFVPNLGQWEHPARFVHRSGPLTLFLEDRGWRIDLVSRPVEPESGSSDVHRRMPVDGGVALVQPQVGLPRGAIGAVTGEAFVQQDGPNVAIVLQRLLRNGRGGNGKSQDCCE